MKKVIQKFSNGPKIFFKLISLQQIRTLPNERRQSIWEMRNKIAAYFKRLEYLAYFEKLYDNVKLSLKILNSHKSAAILLFHMDNFKSLISFRNWICK